MILLNECKDDVLKKIKELKAIIPEYIEDKENAENPFINHIENNGSISEELLEFLCHTDYLENMDEKTLVKSTFLYDQGAEIGWYEFLKNIYDEEEKDGDALSDIFLEYLKKGISCENANHCFEDWNHDSLDSLRERLDEFIPDIDIEDTSDTEPVESGTEESVESESEEIQNFDDEEEIIVPEKAVIEEVPSGNSDPETDINKMVEQIEMERVRKADDLLAHSYKVLFDQQRNITDRLNKELAEAEEKYKTVSLEKDKLTEQITEIFNNLENSISIGQESKREAIQLKAENERLKLRLESKDKFIERNNQKNVEYISRIQELEGVSEDQRITIQELQEKLEKCESELAEKEKALEDLSKQLNEMSIAAENYRQELEGIKSSGDYTATEADGRSVSDNEDYYDDQDEYTKESSGAENAEETSLDGDLDGFEDYSNNPGRDFKYTDIQKIQPDKETIKKKSSWFSKLIVGFSKLKFLGMDRKKQESSVFEKMMEMKLPFENSKLIRTSLKKYGEKVPCFDLYEFICTDPSKDEILSFFAEYEDESEVSLNE